MLKRSLVVPLFLLWTALLGGQRVVVPTSIVAPALEKAAAVTLKPWGNPERFQVTVLDWSQDPSGQDVTGPAKAVIAAPSIVEIPPGSRRAVRLVRTKASARPATTACCCASCPSRPRRARCSC